MDGNLIDINTAKSVLTKVGIHSEECDQCMRWTSPELDESLTREDMVVAELTPGEQGLLRCMGYAYEEKVVDTLRLRALYETFWIAVRSQHNLPMSDLAIKQGKFIVAI